MGDNLYTEFWRSKLDEILLHFRNNELQFKINVNDIANFGNRTSYTCSFTINQTILETPKSAHAPGRDLFSVLNDSEYFNQFLSDKRIRITINASFELNVEILDLSTPSYFTEDDFEHLEKFQFTRKNDDNVEHNNTYNHLKETYKKVEYWGKTVQEKVFPNGYFTIRKRPTNQGSHFESYQWGKIYPDRATSEFGKLAFTVSISTDTGFTIKIDTVGLLDSDPIRIKYFENRGEYHRSPIIKHISADTVLLWSWEKLIDNTISVIESLVPAYFNIYALLGGKESAYSKSVKNKKNMDLNTIFYGPPGTGKTYKIQNELINRFNYPAVGLDEIEFVNEVRNFSWWQVIAAALYVADAGGVAVPDLIASRLIKAKFKPTQKHDTPNHILWSILQDKTDIFLKNLDSKWKINKDFVDDNFPEIKQLHGLLAENALNAISSENSHYTFLTFHQSYNYEDFIEGIKPILNNNTEEKTISYELKKGVFYQACLNALQLMGYTDFEDCYNDTFENRKQKALTNRYNYAVFIDEINRGNISSIFGELITLIEADKRIGTDNELWVDLPYSRTKFAVPANLFIVGTMNTADRSVEALDTALRRRFSFEEMQPNEQHDFIRAVDISGTIFNFKEILTTINKRVEKLSGRDHKIGHSYFMDKEGDRKWEFYHLAFKDRIIPLLQEYFYGDYGKMCLVLGTGFVDIDKKSKSDFADVEYEGIEELNEKKIWVLNSIGDDAGFANALKILLNKKQPTNEGN